MSSNTYTLKIDIDDSKIRDIEKRLMNIVGGGSGKQGGGIGGAMTSASGGGKQAGMMKSIMKIAGIAVGVLAIVSILRKLSGMLVSSSPMLQQMLKLINFGVMLILRPIGDFFGFFLRPIVLFILRNYIIPFYRIARKPMMQLGDWLGKSLVDNPVGALLSLTPIGAIISNWDTITQSLEGHVMSWELDIKKWTESLNLPNLGDMATYITTWIDSLNLPTFDSLILGFTTWIDNQVKLLPLFGQFIFSGFVDWIIRGVNGLPTWESITTGIDTWISENLGTLPTWDDVTATITAVKASIQGIIQAIMDFFSGIASFFGLDINNNNNNPTKKTPAPQLELPDLGQIGEDISNWFEDMKDKITGAGQ